MNFFDFTLVVTKLIEQFLISGLKQIFVLLLIGSYFCRKNIKLFDEGLTCLYSHFDRHSIIHVTLFCQFKTLPFAILK
jgi:hypothetical protein